tara:strand:- start:1390 stop:3093 length:1704 start_codon:yes stop_codon:yes gene_type:complete
MCGITGYISEENKENLEKIIVDMTRIISHRGPDYQNHLCHKSIALGHSRLSIIDTSPAAHQPFTKSHVDLVFNGEIYNFKGLKKEHLGNETFSSSSDTEVLIKLYLKYGLSKTLSLIRGMFAFALFDKKLNKIFLVVDHVGKKPLYYINHPKYFCFSSEIKSFKKIPNFNFDFNFESLNNFYYYRYNESFSCFKNISMVKPGHILEFDIEKKSSNVSRFFKFTDLINESIYHELDKKSSISIIEKFNYLLNESIKKRLVADVPVATINSGGIDSSLMSAIAFNIDPIQMLHIDVEGKSELYFAELLSKKLEIQLLTKKISPIDVETNFKNTIYHFEHPLVHPNAYGISEVSSLAKKNNIKVLLSGEGADELFGGYGYQHSFYKQQRLNNFFGKNYIILINKLYKYLRSATRSYSEAKSYDPTLFATERIKYEERFNQVYSKLGHILNMTERNATTCLINDLSEYLFPLLIRADKMGMQHSVEIRCPYLDLDLIEFAINLPIRYKMSLRKRKIIVKTLGKNYLPKGIIDRKKIGFPMPSLPSQLNQQESISRQYVIDSIDVLKHHFIN